jgi:hypothetical protein
MLMTLEDIDMKDLPAALNTRVKPHIRILNASMDDDPMSKAGIILNGRIDTSTLRFLQVDTEYQRPLGERADIIGAYKSGRVVPNIVVGVRGQGFRSDGDDIVIDDPAYIIDGYQRVGNALRLLDVIPHQEIRLFGTFHFDTNQDWEASLFTDLNKNAKKISPNIHLRNMRASNSAVLTLFGISNNVRDFPLFKKISWSQNVQRGELMTALTMSKVSVELHRHKTTVSGASVEGIARSVKMAADAVSLNTFRQNVFTFFKIIDECWPYASIEYRKSAAQAKAPFLMVVSRMLSDHPVFWDDDGCLLKMHADDRRKLAKFPVNDPSIVHLTGASGPAHKLLYTHLVSHMNSGRRTQRLESRSEAGASQ